MPIIKESLKRLWNAEEIRTLVLVSLCLQFGLAFLSPLRKRTGQKLLKLLLWFFYLIADSVAILALGNLLRRQPSHGGIDLMAFWSPFLLLHLGGPDTITSYSIEDNELWWRHFLGLVVQVVVAFMVWLELVAIPRLRVAAAFVFIAGLIKYSERTWALRSSSMDQLRKSMLEPGSIENIERKNEPPPAGQLPSNIDAPGKIYDRVHIVEAYEFFKIFKPFVVDHRLSRETLTKSRTYFSNCSVWKAFKVVEIELSFLYDVLHTKAILINGLCGCLWRFISLGMITSAFVLFLKSEKRGHAKADIIISYILFGSALFMELISLLLIITSDWMIVALIKEKKHSLLKNLAVIIVKVMSCFFPKGKRRWSNSMGQYSLLSFSLRDKKNIFRWILGAVKVKELWDHFIFVRSVPVPSELKELLFKELKTKTGENRPSDITELRDIKLEKVLEQEEFVSDIPFQGVGFNDIILIWHIATDRCFHTHGVTNENPETGHGRNDNNSHSDRKISLIMSNYMMYLLIMQPSMMPDGIEAIRKFQELYTETKKIFREKGKGLTKERAREALFGEVDSRTDYPLPGQPGKFVLKHGCKLAKKLNDELAENKRWRLISRVWVEMLCYVAINCKTYYHSKQLSQGGELLTHIMLLMVHMGIPQKTPLPMDFHVYESLPLYN